MENSSSDTDNVTNEADNAASETSNTSSYLNSLSLNEELGALQAKSAAIYNEL